MCVCVQDPTPRMIARTQALLQHQQQAAAGDGGSHPGQQQQQQNVQESGPPDSPFGTYALPADASLQDAQLLHRVLEGVKESEQAEGGGSTASSLSFQSMLQSAARNSSRQNLTDAGSESGYTSATPSEAGFRTPGPSDGGGSGSAGGGAGAAAGPATISMDADGSYLVGGGVLPAEAGSGNTHTNDDDQTQSPSLQQSPHPPQLDRSGSLVLKPPLPHPPFSSAGSRSSSGRGAGASRPQPSISPGSQRRSPGSNSSSGDGGGGGSGGSSGAGGDHAAVDIKVAGLVLLHPNLSGHQVPAFTRLLAASSLGRSMLRPLLRSEVCACWGKGARSCQGGRGLVSEAYDCGLQPQQLACVQLPSLAALPLFIPATHTPLPCCLSGLLLLTIPPGFASGWRGDKPSGVAQPRPDYARGAAAVQAPPQSPGLGRSTAGNKQGSRQLEPEAGCRSVHGCQEYPSTACHRCVWVLLTGCRWYKWGKGVS